MLDGAPSRPRGAVLAVAGPVHGDEIALTNRPWRFRLCDLSERFGLKPIHALNDFEALAWALPLLSDDDVRVIGANTQFNPGVKAVLGPGTGLGVAALVPDGKNWHVIASEGGHASFGAGARDEEPLFRRLHEDGLRVSAETLLSGPGLPRLHGALHPGTLRLKPEMIVTQARAGNREARATIAMFVRLLGRFAGDTALTFKATGGVYLTGGVALALNSLFDEAVFRAAFEAHPPYEKLLAAIPTALITYQEPGLLGCATIAGRLMREIGTA